MPRRRRGKDGAQLVRLLLGRDKSTQTADVARAPEFWKAEQETKPHGCDGVAQPVSDGMKRRPRRTRLDSSFRQHFAV